MWPLRAQETRRRGGSRAFRRYRRALPGLTRPRRAPRPRFVQPALSAGSRVLRALGSQSRTSAVEGAARARR